VQALLPPATLSRAPACMGSVPALGEHSANILGALGLSGAQVDALRAQGAI
jgi:crotonobetainyl-CoA:carnitine CoA-transferase CaiB-like acyl-CoA transferase